jgi:hypothetical protein
MNKPIAEPLTQAQILAKKKQAREPEQYVLITNRSSIQTVHIQLRAPAGVPFVVGEQTIPLLPQASSRFPKSRLMSEQITNLTKLGLLKVQSR